MALVTTSQQSDANAVGLAQKAQPCIWPIGDSITYGVGPATLAGYREPLYNLLHPSTDLYLVGTQSYAGASGGLAADPWNDGYPGYLIRTGQGGSLLTQIALVPPSQFPIATIVLAGTNDIGIGDDSASTALASMSTFLDLIWSMRTGPKFQIVLCQILKRLDSFDPVVQSFNAGLAAMVATKAYAGSVIIVPMYGAVQNPTIYDATTNPTGGYHDDVHPSDSGATDMATLLAPYVQQAIAAWGTGA